MTTEQDVMIVADPGGTQEAGTLYALVCEHGDGNEGLLGIPGPLGIGVIPAVVLSLGTAERMLVPYAKDVAAAVKKPVRLVKYTVEEILTEFMPEEAEVGNTETSEAVEQGPADGEAAGQDQGPDDAAGEGPQGPGVAG